MTKIPRDNSYGRPPKWSKVYAEFCPDHRDSASRHVKCFAESLRDIKSPLRAAMVAAGYEPDHIAQSLEVTVIGLWRLRKQTAKEEGQ